MRGCTTSGVCVLGRRQPLPIGYAYGKNTAISHSGTNLNRLWLSLSGAARPTGNPRPTDPAEEPANFAVEETAASARWQRAHAGE